MLGAKTKMYFDLDAFEEMMLSLTKLSDEEFGEKVLFYFHPNDPTSSHPATTLEEGAVEVHNHLQIGEIEDALSEFEDQFRLHLEPGSTEEKRVRAILERVCNLIQAKECEQ